MGFWSLLAVALIVLKLLGYITIGWLAIGGICVGIPILLVIGYVLMCGLIAAFATSKKKAKRESDIRAEMDAIAKRFKK